VSRADPRVIIADPFRPLPEYCIDPLEYVAIGLKLGQDKLEKAKLWALERALGEKAIIGDCSIRVELRPPADARPPEPWLHEFVKPKYLAQAKRYLFDD
jgi:hypothetical protein